MYRSGGCVIPIDVVEIGGSVDIQVQADEPISVCAVSIDNAVKVSCSVVCVEQQYQVFNAADGEFILFDGNTFNVKIA